MFTTDMVPSFWPAKYWPCLQLAVNEEVLYALCLTAELLATEDYVVSCISTGELTRCQWLVPNLRSHRQFWLNSEGHKTKQKAVSVGKKSVGNETDKNGK